MLILHILFGIFSIGIISLIELWLISETFYDGDDFDFSTFNPVKNYDRWTSMNWFGVILFTLMLNLICPGLAVGYWFWKLCTVGRKE